MSYGMLLERVWGCFTLEGLAGRQSGQDGMAFGGVEHSASRSWSAYRARLGIFTAGVAMVDLFHER